MALSVPDVLATEAAGALATVFTKDINCTAGDLLTVITFGGHASSGVNACTHTDENSNTYTKRVVDLAIGGARPGPLTISTAIANTTNAANTVTLTFSAAVQRFGLVILRQTGHDATTPFLQSKTATGSGTSAAVTLDGTPAATSCIISACVVEGTTGTDITPPAAFTQLADLNINAANNYFLQVQYDLASASTAGAGQTWATGTHTWGAGAIEIAESGGAPAVTTHAGINRGLINAGLINNGLIR